MSLPDKILVTVTKCDSSSSGSPPPQNIFNHVVSSDPPEYEADNNGDFHYGKLLGIKDGSGDVVNYELTVRIIDAGSPCNGWNIFRRDPGSDDPVGSYCTKDGTGVDCSDATASIVVSC